MKVTFKSEPSRTAGDQRQGPEPGRKRPPPRRGPLPGLYRLIHADPSDAAILLVRRAKIVAVLFLLWLMAVSFPALHFAPGNGAAVRRALTQIPASPLAMVMAILLSLALTAFVVLFSWLVRAARHRKKKADDDHQLYREPLPIPPSIYLLVLVLLFSMGGLFWAAWQLKPAPGSGTLVPPLSSSLPSRRRTPVPTGPATPMGRSQERVQASPWLGYLPAGVLALALAAWLGYLYRRKHRQRPVRSPAKVDHVLTRAVADLQGGGQLPDVILRCYRDMYRILSAKVSSHHQLTAREFVRQLQLAGVGEEEVRRLTSLFERVRYGRLPGGPRERAEAVELLQAIASRYARETEAGDTHGDGS